MPSKSTCYRNVAKATYQDVFETGHCSKSSELSQPERDSDVNEPVDHCDRESSLTPENSIVHCSPNEAFESFNLHDVHDGMVESKIENDENPYSFGEDLPDSDNNDTSLILDGIDFESGAQKTPPGPKCLALNLAEWALKSSIAHRNVNGLLKILKGDHPELPSDARTLLGTVRDKAPVLSMGNGSFIYFGLAINLLKLLRDFKLCPADLVLTFNIDGQSPF